MGSYDGLRVSWFRGVRVFGRVNHKASPWVVRPLKDLSAAELHERRERVFLVLAGLFLGTLAMLNILGVSRFITLGSVGDWTFAVAVGVLPYPVTFLCTDFISELYGRRRANTVVLVGLMLNVWVVGIMWLGGVLPPVPELVNGVPLVRVHEGGGADVPYDYAFWKIRQLTFGAVAASMAAYLAAQFCDVYLFHFWKRLTKGKHLWLRNNGSTLVSQLVDTVAVILITHFYARALPVDAGSPVWPQLLVFIASAYVFKLGVALLDTIPFYIGTKHLSRYLRIDVSVEHDADAEEAGVVSAVD